MGSCRVKCNIDVILTWGLQLQVIKMLHYFYFNTQKKVLSVCDNSTDWHCFKADLEMSLVLTFSQQVGVVYCLAIRTYINIISPQLQKFLRALREQIPKSSPLLSSLCLFTFPPPHPSTHLPLNVLFQIWSSRNFKSKSWKIFSLRAEAAHSPFILNQVKMMLFSLQKLFPLPIFLWALHYGKWVEEHELVLWCEMVQVQQVFSSPHTSSVLPFLLVVSVLSLLWRQSLVLLHLLFHDITTEVKMNMTMSCLQEDVKMSWFEINRQWRQIWEINRRKYLIHVYCLKDKLLSTSSSRL